MTNYTGKKWLNCIRLKKFFYEFSENTANKSILIYSEVIIMPRTKENITEIDLFNFVFFKHLLDEEKKQIIMLEEKFKESINFYSGMHNELSKDLSLAARKKIASLIPSYRLTDKVELFPIGFTKMATKRNTYVASADESLNPGFISMSLTDEEKSYLARIVCQHTHCQMFIFSSNNSILRNFDVTIYPQRKKYHFEDNTKPVELNAEPDIEKLVMTLQ
ncbi:MAG: hypothetical protein C4539_19330 [Ignavibacteriales bacterium]|nr:MAG: hypothetical protein C4539_19330 [Ignavibacteriales bacterium]